MNVIAHIQIAPAQNTECAHALMVETTAAWIAARLEDRTQTDLQTITRLEDTGLGFMRHAEGQYHLSIAGISGTGLTPRAALIDWIATRNTKEAQNV